MARLARVLIALALAVALFPVTSPAGPVSADYDIPSGHFFTQTGGGGGRGFSVTDEAGVAFWSEFQRLGGVNAVGYPVSTRFQWNGFTVQAMQRVVFQWRPDVRQVYFANVFDLLTEAGKDEWLFTERQTPRPLPASFDAGKDWNGVVQGRLALLDENPAIRAQYYAVAGDPIQMNGLPTSRVTDMGNNYTLRAQRVVIQQWKENVPWAAAGQVTVALGGTIAGEAGLLLSSALVPQGPGGAALPQTPITPPSDWIRGYGFQVDPGNDYPRALQMTKNAGFNWVKFQVRWDQVEATQGSIDYRFLDGVVSGAEKAGVKLLLSVTTAPRWSRQGQDLGVTGPPNDPQAMGRFMAALATRYKGKVGAYEVWNEPNLAREWGGPGRQNAAQYVALLQAVYRSVKAADPAAKVISGALTPAGNVNLGYGALAIDDLEYLRQLYQAGIKGSFDGLGVHPNGFNNAPEMDPRDPSVLDRAGGFRAHRSFYFRNFELYREIMVEFGDAERQMWFTEFGWASGGDAGDEWAFAHDNTEQQQAEYMGRSIQIIRERPYIAVAVVWNLNFFSVDEAKRAFALIRPDWTARPAYSALVAAPK